MRCVIAAISFDHDLFCSFHGDTQIVVTNQGNANTYGYIDLYVMALQRKILSGENTDPLRIDFVVKF